MRIKSIDVLRGLTVAAMILVNNGAGPMSYAPLQHSAWNGLTICDMVFPTFLFLVGISTYISLSKTDFAFTQATFIKICKRAFWIIVIGWAIHYVDYLCKADFLPFAHFRVTGVLTRIGICYFLTAFIAIACPRRAVTFIIAFLLVAYSLILILGNGYSMEADSMIVRFDRAVLGSEHLYIKKPVDPEGLLSTMSALAHTLIGFCVGGLLSQQDRQDGRDRQERHDTKGQLGERMLKVMAWGFVLLCAGYALEQLLPLNKRIWSPSYVLVSCGYASLALGVFALVCDINKQDWWFWPLQVFGCNPLFLYALSEVVAIVMSATHAKAACYAGINVVFSDPCVASLVYALLFVLVMWLIGLPLYRKKIYIKL